MRLVAYFLLVLCGCTPAIPGEVVGTYRVTMRLEQNSCGPAAVYLLDGEQYSVQLRSDERHGYWRLADGKPIPGSFDQDGSFQFSFTALVASSDPDAGTPGCQLVQTELLSGKVVVANAAAEKDGGSSDADPTDAGKEPAGSDDGVKSADSDDGAASTDSDTAKTTLTGTHVLSIAPVAGAECGSALITGGGPFEALPCTVTYSLTGHNRAEF